jgi:hypothetical protein
MAPFVQLPQRVLKQGHAAGFLGHVPKDYLAQPRLENQTRESGLPFGYGPHFIRS